MRLINSHYCILHALYTVIVCRYKNITYWRRERNGNGCSPGIGVFSGEPTEWEDYVERLENYFVAHDIKTEAKKTAVLLSKCGMATYKLIKSLLAPQKPSDVEYKVLLRKAKQHFSPYRRALWNATSLIHVYSNPVNQ